MSLTFRRELDADGKVKRIVVRESPGRIIEQVIYIPDRTRRKWRCIVEFAKASPPPRKRKE